MTLARGVAAMANRRIPGDRGDGGCGMALWQRVLLARLTGLRHLLWLMAVLCVSYSPASAATLNFTVNTSEPVVVTGTPRIAIDVGGVTRYASYASGSGSSALTFGYAVQAGDFDANGITLVSPLQLNGGSIADALGNLASNPVFTLPDTSALKVQTYTAAFTTSPITNNNATGVNFAITKAPVGASFSYTITSSGGSGSVTGSGTIASSSSHAVSGVDVSALPSGTLTLSVTVSTTAGGTGAAKTATATPTFTGTLDSVSTAAAFSVRRLRSAYTGALLRVRRSSDSTEQDIGAATIGGNLDTAALTSFCGSASCYVSTWYDQSGGGRNATQSTAASQPRIAASGVLEAVNTRPAIKADGVDDQMLFPLGPLVAYPVSINLVLAKASASDQGSWVKLGGLVGSGAGGISIGVGDNSCFCSPGQNIVGLKEYVVWMPTATVLASSAIITFTQNATSNSTAMFQNGATVSPVNAANAPKSPDGTTGYLFGHLISGQQRWSRNPIAEVVLLPSLLSDSARQALERDQGSYYGISVP